MTAYWRRATAAGVMAAMLGGMGVNVVFHAAGLIMFNEFKPYPLLGIDPIVWGMSLSALMGVVVSLCTTPPSAALVSRLFDARQRPPADADAPLAAQPTT
jgi:SSS family solute:Na+ symporter/sodium/pantothenate symporter